MALNQTEEEKKRKLKSAPWLNRSNPMSTYNEEGKPIKLNQTPRIINAIDNLKNTAEYRKSINDPSKAFGAEASTNEPGITLKNIQTPARQTSPLGEPKVPKLYEDPTSLNLPKINETPNTQRDSELGKMTVSTEGDIVTYDIGGNTLSYNRNDNDRQNKTNLERINSNGSQRVGNLDITVDPSVPINERGRGLGNMMGPAGTPTWDDYHKQQQARYDAYANAQKGRFFGATPLESEQPVDNSIGGMFVRGLQSKKDRSDAQIINAEADRDMNRANFLSTLDRNQIARDQLSLDADKNRIDEQGVIAENKLRGIQGDVLQNPPIKENPLKPLVIEEPDPNDPTGMAKRQVIKMPNAEGTGYVDNMPTATTTPQVTPEQRTKINALIKANPNITREAILQKIANGEI